MSELEETSKALAEAAKFGTKGLEVTEKLGTFFAKVFKAPLEDTAGIIGDKLKFMRWQRQVRMADEVNRILTQREISDTKAVLPKLALPILENASLEEDDTLQNLWVKLLANAMYPNFKNPIMSAFIGIIKELEPMDAKILENVYRRYRRCYERTPTLVKDDIISVLKNNSFHKKELVKDLNITGTIYELSVANLFRVRCLEPFIEIRHDMLPRIESSLFEKAYVTPEYHEEPITLYKGSSEVVLTMLGKNFVEACIL
jgi:hypothetical protein